MGLLLHQFLCAITGAAFFLLSDAVPTHLRTADPNAGHAPLSNESLVPTTEKPKIVWSTTDKTRHETGGSEGCFGISTGSGGADLFALSPNVIAITFPEYGCKGQPTVAVCGADVAGRLQQSTTTRAQRQSGLENGDDDDKTAAPLSTGSQPSTSCGPEPAQILQYDDPENAFRGTALQLPRLKTLGCTAKTSSIQFAVERATVSSDPNRFALEEYSTFKSLRMPEPAVAKSVFLARVESAGAIPAVQSPCVPAQAPLTKPHPTEASAAVPCPETSPASTATGATPAVMATPVSENISTPKQTLTLECPRETANKIAGVPAPMTSPMTNVAPALFPGPVGASVSPPEMSPAPASTAARVPTMATPAPVPVVYVVDD